MGSRVYPPNRYRRSPIGGRRWQPPCLTQGKESGHSGSQTDGIKTKSTSEEFIQTHHVLTQISHSPTRRRYLRDARRVLDTIPHTHLVAAWRRIGRKLAQNCWSLGGTSRSKHNARCATGQVLESQCPRARTAAVTATKTQSPQYGDGCWQTFRQAKI